MTQLTKKPSERENLLNSFRAMKWYEWVMAAIMIVIAAYYMVLSFGSTPKLMEMV